MRELIYSYYKEKLKNKNSEIADEKKMRKATEEKKLTLPIKQLL